VHLWVRCTPIRESRPQRSVDSSAGLIAVFHALHRLLAPRHPPHALSSLAALTPPPGSYPGAKVNLQTAGPAPRSDWGPGVTITLSKGHSLRDRTNCRPCPPTPKGWIARPLLVICNYLPLPGCQRTSGVPRGRLRRRCEEFAFLLAMDTSFLADRYIPTRAVSSFFHSRRREARSRARRVINRPGTSSRSSR
jgi:hypothetical protein